MADKSVTLHQPVASDVRRIIIEYTSSQVVRVTAHANVRSTPEGSETSASATVERSDLGGALLTTLDGLASSAATVIRNRNGF